MSVEPSSGLDGSPEVLRRWTRTPFCERRFRVAAAGEELSKVDGDAAMDVRNSGRDRDPVKNLKDRRVFHVLAPRF